ncbi:MAG: coenzyme F420 hydrogenase [Alphaproteobacteria bacterium]|nr:coenzyme F420 hydrogenase [Alphaproteobacteria bacterium]
MVLTPEGTERPVVEAPLDTATVDRIYETCPGTRVEGLPQALLDPAAEIDPVWGPHLRIVRAFAADPEIRFRASTGGVLTALAIYLLDSGRAEFIVHAKASTTHPTWGERHLSFDRAEIVAGAGSRYGPTAPLKDFREILDRGRPFAFIGKPCDVAAVRNLARYDDRVDALCRYQMVPVCGGFMEPVGMRAFLRSLNIAERQLAKFDYRGNGCPGPTRIETTDGRVIEKNYLDMWGEDEAAWRLPFRCKICPDGIGEAADIAASDTWPGGSPTWDGQAGDKGTNGVVARTRAGAELLAAAAAAGAISIECEITARDMDDYQPHQVRKKHAAWARYVGLKAAGQLAPDARRLRLVELARDNGIAANLAQAKGTRRRAREGRAREPRPRAATD